MGFFLLTNNPRVAAAYPDLEVRCIEGSVLSLFYRARDHIHRGHRLLTHPLSGSLQPGRIPYKTVFLTAEKSDLDLDSLRHIENSIEICLKTMFRFLPDWKEESMNDYSTLDLSHVEAALESIKN